jgi:WD40 repeat protein
MDNQDQRVREIFDEAIKITDAGARRAYLDRACAGESALRKEIESLLQAHFAAGDFLRKTAVLPPPDPRDERAGTKIGRYKLLEKIGEGGFGVVWMAEQEEPVRRRVALKIIKLGMDTKEVVARFEAERQALAMMDHPNIASVYDAGATETGRPYFVMELVKGISITEFCDQRKLSTRERLELFTQVCSAVQHAHQKGIIHRDLKPSNILVTLKDDQPLPKVIDFGVVKAMQMRLTEKTMFTRMNLCIGTPAYMSPEQAGLGSLDVDTRSDIYSLGVLLYELLTGRTPFDLQTMLAAGYDAVMRYIREEEPPKPSTRLSELKPEERTAVAGKRQADPAKLNRLVRGELDWIVMKALEKDRKRRYETASGFARDIQAYLHEEPVSAAAPTFAYRLAKLVRRHRTAAAVTAGFVAILVLTTMVTSTLALYAHRQQLWAQKSERITKDNLYAADMGLAKEAMEKISLDEAKGLLQEYIPKNGEQDLRGLEWRYLWARARGNWLAKIPTGMKNRITAVQLTPNDEFIIAAGDTGTLSVIRFKDFKTVFCTNTSPGGGSVNMDLSADGKVVALAGQGAVTVWDVGSDGSLTLRQKIDVKSPYAIAVSPDGATVAVGTEAGYWKNVAFNRGTTLLFDTKTGQPGKPLPDSGGRAAAFSADGKWLATSARDGKSIQLWRTTDWVLDRSISFMNPLSLSFSANGCLLLDAGDGVGIHDLAHSTKFINLHNAFASVSPAGRYLLPSHITMTDDQRLVACVTVVPAVADLQNQQCTPLLGHPGGISCMAFTHRGDLLLTGGGNRDLLLWAENGTTPRQFSLQQEISGCMSLPLPPGSPNGCRTAYRKGNTVLILNPQTQKTEQILSTPAFPLTFVDNESLLAIRGLNLLENHNWIIREAPTNDTPVLELWNLRSQTCRQIPVDITGMGAITSVATAPARDAVALSWSRWAPGPPTHGVTVISLSSGSARVVFSGVAERAKHVSFSSDGKRLALACDGGKVPVLDASSLTPVATADCEGNNADYLTFSPDGKLLAVACWDAVRLFTVSDGRLLLRLTPGAGRYVRFSDDGKTLIGDSFEVVHVWRLPSGRRLFSLGSPRWNLLDPLTGEKYIAASTAGRWDALELPPLNDAEAWMESGFTNLDETRQWLHGKIDLRDSKAPANLIPLDAYYDSSLDRNWHGNTSGNDNILVSLPVGIQAFKSVSFDIRGLVLPDKKESRSIRVAQNCKKLHFLHNSAMTALEPWNLVGRYVIHYADGQTAEIPLVTGRNIQDWWADPKAIGSNDDAQVVWVGSNPEATAHQCNINLVMLTWNNPKPDVQIQSVDFLQVGNGGQPFLVALTAE